MCNNYLGNTKTGQMIKFNRRKKLLKTVCVCVSSQCAAMAMTEMSRTALSAARQKVARRYGPAPPG